MNGRAGSGSWSQFMGRQLYAFVDVSRVVMTLANFYFTIANIEAVNDGCQDAHSEGSYETPYTHTEYFLKVILMPMLCQMSVGSVGIANEIFSKNIEALSKATHRQEMFFAGIRTFSSGIFLSITLAASYLSSEIASRGQYVLGYDLCSKHPIPTVDLPFFVSTNRTSKISSTITIGINAVSTLCVSGVTMFKRLKHLQRPVPDGQLAENLLRPDG